MNPRGLTCDELWRMATGRERRSREHAVQQAMCVWSGPDDVDVHKFIRHGTVAAPLTIDDVMSPTLAAQVEEENHKLVAARNKG